MSKQKPMLVEKISGKAKYNAVYLGWKECPGLCGLELTEPVIHDMVYGPRPEQFSFDNLPRLTIAVTKSELAITQMVRKGNGKSEKLKFQTIPMKNLTFAARGSGPDDLVVACIVVGFNPASTCWVHVHAYLCETKVDAETLLRHLRQFIDTPAQRDRLQRLEKQMIQKGQIPAPLRSFSSIEGFSELGPSSYGAATGIPGKGAESGGVPSSNAMNGQPPGGSEVSIYGTSAEMFPARGPSNPASYGSASEVSGYGTPLSNPLYTQSGPEVNIYGTSTEMFPARFSSDDPTRIGVMQPDMKTGLGNPYGAPQPVDYNNLDVDGHYGAVNQNRLLPRSSPQPLRRTPTQRDPQMPDASTHQLKINQLDDKRSNSPNPKSPNFDGSNLRSEQPNGGAYSLGFDRPNVAPNVETRPTASDARFQSAPAVVPQNAYRDYRPPRQEYPEEDYDGPISPPPVDYAEGPMSPTIHSTTIEDKLAAELKRKLGKGPILLPPKDYDTVNRTHGNLIGIEARKCLNENIVGKGENEEGQPTGYRPNTRPNVFGLGYS